MKMYGCIKGLELSSRVSASFTKVNVRVFKTFFEKTQLKEHFRKKLREHVL